MSNTKSINSNSMVFENITPIPARSNNHEYGAKPQREEKKIEKVACFATSYVTRKGATKYVYALVPFPAPAQDKWRAFCSLYEGSGNPYAFQIDGMVAMVVNRSADEGKDAEIREGFNEFIKSEMKARKWKQVSEKDIRKLHAEALKEAHKAQAEHKKAQAEKAKANREKCMDI